MRKPIDIFPAIAREAFGDRGCVVLSAVLYFELFSCLAIFFVSLGDHLHALFPGTEQSRQMTIVAGVLTVPSALLRTPRLLSYLSAVMAAVVLAVALSASAMLLAAGAAGRTTRGRRILHVRRRRRGPDNNLARAGVRKRGVSHAGFDLAHDPRWRSASRRCSRASCRAIWRWAMELLDSVVKIVLIFLALAVAVFFPSFSFLCSLVGLISFLCSLVGLICTMIMSVIFPALAHLQLFGTKLALSEEIVDWLLVAGGSVQNGKEGEAKR